MKALTIVTMGAAFSALAYCDENGRPVTALPPAELGMHEFSATDDGCMVHKIDNEVRAIVPPGSVLDYARFFPDCLPLAKQLAGADRVTPGPTTSSDKVVDDAHLAAAIAGLGLAPQ
jgi:hypothetical protein